MEPPFAHMHIHSPGRGRLHTWIYFVIFVIFYCEGRSWYVRRITTWGRHCASDPSLPPWEGLMEIGLGTANLMMINFDNEEFGDEEGRFG